VTAATDDVTPPCHVAVAMSSLFAGCIDEDDEDERADLIGDLSKKHVLPLERNLKHADLKTISPHTVSIRAGNIERQTSKLSEHFCSNDFCLIFFCSGFEE